MKTKLCIGILLLVATLLPAQTTNLTALLQQGLFEEQASRNLDAAIADYQSLATQFDKDRQLAATAVFRLGECYRAQGKTGEAAVQYQRILRDFADQTTLATLSRQNLTGLGMGKADVAVPAPAEENADAQLFKKLEGRDEADLEKLLPTLMPNGTLETLLKERGEAKIQRAKLLVDYAPDNVEVVRLDTQIKAYDQQVVDTISGMMQALRVRSELPASQSTARTADLTAPVSSEEDQEIARIQKMIQNSPDLINSAEGAYTPLTFAASKGWLKAATYLMDHGAEVNMGEPRPLNSAALVGNRAMVELLLSRGADVNSKDSLGKAPLATAAEKGYSSVVEVLLANKADVNAQDGSGETALSYVAAHGQIKIVQTLLAAGADPNLGDKNGRTPFSFAMTKGSPEITQLWLAAKADPNRGESDLPLLLAINKKDLASAELLLQAGANPDLGRAVYAFSIADNSTVTPLRAAVYQKQPAMVQLLLKYKADPNASPIKGWALLFGGLSDTNIVQALLSAGAKVDPVSPDEQEWTPLGAAVDQNLVTAVDILLKHGANPNVSNRNGVRPLHHAAYHLIDTNIFEMLFAAGADPNVRTGNGETPLDFLKKVQVQTETPAADKKRAGELVDLLRRHGALDELPDFTRIRVTRQGRIDLLSVFKRPDSGFTNQFTLLESVTRFYARPTVSQRNVGNQPPSQVLPFPDFGRIIIHRAAQKMGAKEQEIKVSLLNRSNLLDCAQDVPVQFGDVIEIPESVHALNATTPDPVQELENAFTHTVKLSNGSLTFISGAASVAQQDACHAAAACLEKSVHLTVDGDSAGFKLYSWREGYLHEALTRSEARSILRSSSDLSRVRVTRKTAAASPVVFTVNITSDARPVDLLWLQDGDVIEVPDKP